MQFTYQPGLDTDLCMFPNKDAVFFPERVPDPDGRPSYAMLHRPMWDLGWFREGETVHLPAGVTDERPGHLDLLRPRRARRGRHPRTRATPGPPLCRAVHVPYEELKIGAGPPPVRVDEGWLLIHHGVSGEQPVGFDPTTQKVEYAAGAMLLDADDPSRVLARTAEPILRPETADERDGTVPNVVFPTAIEEIDGVRYVFYGMADAKIGVARLDRTP